MPICENLLPLGFVCMDGECFSARDTVSLTQLAHADDLVSRVRYLPGLD